MVGKRDGFPFSSHWFFSTPSDICQIHLECFMYYVLMSLIGFACVVLGWDAVDGVALYQLSILFGGAVIGHLLTLALNAETEQ